MKKNAVLPVILAFLAACTNPLLKWIDTPGGSPVSPTAPDAGPRALLASDKAITSFSFGIGGETDVIQAEPRERANDKTPITVVLPAGNDRGSLPPPVITFIGKSLDPPSGVPQNFNSPQPYRVTAQDGTTRDYEVEVIVKTLQSAEIIWFDLELPGSGGRYMAEGFVQEGSGTEPGEIILHVPSGTDPSFLTAKIVQTGKSLTAPNAVAAQAFSGTAVTLNGDFSRQVTYTVEAEDGSAKQYVIKVVVDLSPAREITALSFEGVTSDPAIIAGVPRNDGKYPVVVTVPAGTVIAALTPVITHTGASISGPGFSSPGGPGTVTAGGAVDFSGTVPYTVTAENGGVREYEVTVFVRGSDNSNKKITGFFFRNPMAVGDINQDNRTITVKVPYGTDLSSLVPTVFYEGISLDPESDRANSFSSTAVYTVRALNGTALAYTVTVTPGLNSAKEITALSFPGAGVLETVIGSVPGPDGKIPISVTVTQNTDINSLSPKITHTGVSITPPGGTAQTASPYTDGPRNFANPQTYRIKAEDGSIKDYAVSAHISGGDSAVITGFVFRPADNPALAVQAVGAIDQNGYTVAVALPRSVGAVIPASLKPVVAYIGASITPLGDSAKTANPLTDSGRDFSGSLMTYTVTSLDDTVTREYTVTVTFEEQNLGLSVTFLGITDPNLITESFDQNTGIVRLELNAISGYTSPYEWYLDGKKLNVSSTEGLLELQTAGLRPGQHEVVVVVTKAGVLPGYPVHYTNKVYFLVHE